MHNVQCTTKTSYIETIAPPSLCIVSVHYLFRYYAARFLGFALIIGFLRASYPIPPV
ncbi:MAG: hypothetical protein LBT46_07560 [Planctomycetaceae bacterium]|nr:hypothetical protein [Planctomycetaceae bacterium]